MNNETIDGYCLQDHDRALVNSADVFLRKVANDTSIRPAQLISIAKVLHVFSLLPNRPSAEISATVSVASPRRQFSEISTFHWWEVGVDRERVTIGSGGHFYRPSTGGDTFTTMSWTAIPGSKPAFFDYRDDLWMVPDVQSFCEAVISLDLADTEYRIEINDDNNPFLDDYSVEEPDSEE